MRPAARPRAPAVHLRPRRGRPVARIAQQQGRVDELSRADLVQRRRNCQEGQAARLQHGKGCGACPHSNFLPCAQQSWQTDELRPTHSSVPDGHGAHQPGDESGATLRNGPIVVPLALTCILALERILVCSTSSERRVSDGARAPARKPMSSALLASALHEGRTLACQSTRLTRTPSASERARQRGVPVDDGPHSRRTSRRRDSAAFGCREAHSTRAVIAFWSPANPSGVTAPDLWVTTSSHARSGNWRPNALAHPRQPGLEEDSKEGMRTWLVTLVAVAGPSLLAPRPAGVLLVPVGAGCRKVALLTAVVALEVRWLASCIRRSGARRNPAFSVRTRVCAAGRISQR